ncbi:MAG: YqgE/AlgH family protein [Desulfobacterales bacterium]|nr:YqgE/AlgH family protein [Desulfobacterales bacterium]
MEFSGNSRFKGQFLIAMPGLSDPNFYRSVTCVCEHTSEGALGIVVNRIASRISAKDIFAELNLEPVAQMISSPVYLGGPVHAHEIFILHGPPFQWRGMLMITPTLALSNTRDIIESLALGIGPKAFMIALGCAGWGAGQLEEEIRSNSWLTCPMDEDILFHAKADRKWEAAVKKMGIDPVLLSDTAGHA